MKKVAGERKRSNQRVGISLTSMKKAANIVKIRSRFAKNKNPMNVNLDKLALLATRDPKYLKKATESAAQPIRGN
jgi:hypothetical protein